MKTASKRAIRKTAEATGDLVGNKIAEKTTKQSKINLKVVKSDEIEIPNKRYISPEKRQQIID